MAITIHQGFKFKNSESMSASEFFTHIREFKKDFVACVEDLLYKSSVQKTTELLDGLHLNCSGDSVFDQYLGKEKHIFPEFYEKIISNNGFVSAKEFMQGNFENLNFLNHLNVDGKLRVYPHTSGMYGTYCISDQSLQQALFNSEIYSEFADGEKIWSEISKEIGYQGLIDSTTIDLFSHTHDNVSRIISNFDFSNIHECVDHNRHEQMARKVYVANEFNRLFLNQNKVIFDPHEMAKLVFDENNQALTDEGKKEIELITQKLKDILPITYSQEDIEHNWSYRDILSLSTYHAVNPLVLSAKSRRITI